MRVLSVSGVRVGRVGSVFDQRQRKQKVQCANVRYLVRYRYMTNVRTKFNVVWMNFYQLFQYFFILLSTFTLVGFM